MSRPDVFESRTRRDGRLQWSNGTISDADPNTNPSNDYKDALVTSRKFFLKNVKEWQEWVGSSVVSSACVLMERIADAVTGT